MTREDAIKNIKEHCYFASLLPQAKEALDVAIKALEQEPCKDWHDVPSDEMTLEQARQAVKDLRKKLTEYLWQTPCDDAISRQAVIRWVKTECNPYGKPTLDFESGKKVIEHLKRMSPITPQPKTEALDKIRTEVEALPKTYPFVNHIDMYVKEDDVKKIIDKYKAESEVEDGTKVD